MSINSYQKKSFDDNVKEEIRSVVNIADVVGRHVALRPAGQNFKGLCPFHKEKTPSFTVSPAKGIFYCFGCHKGGDVFNFLMELEGLTFPEAMQQLADEAGVKLAPRHQERESAPEAPDSGQAFGVSKSDVLSVNQMALDFFYGSTRNSKQAIDYFTSRGLTRETIRDFRLGYAPDGWTAFLDFAKSKRVPESTVVGSGLAIVKHETGRVYDRFRDRIMFPIFDIAKRPVGFAGRGLTKDATPKYLNSPETPLYQKSKILYGFYVTQQYVRESKSAIIVEGYMDFLSLYQAGVKNVIATAGTAFTDTHARTLRRFTQNIYLVFDGDGAGIEAARRAITVLAPYNFDIRVLTIPNDEDPDDFVKQHGAQGFLDLLNTAPDYMRFIIKRAISDNSAGTPYGKSTALSALAPLAGAITDSIVQGEFVKQISEALSLPEDLVRRRVKQADVPVAVMERQSRDFSAAYYGTIEGKFIRLLLSAPNLIPQARQFILPETFTDHFSGKLYSMVLTSFDENADLRTLLNNVDNNEIKSAISFAYASGSSEENCDEEIVHVIKRLQDKFIRFQMKANEVQMKNDPAKRGILSEKNKELSLQLKELNG
jgi:DNA primase